MLPAGSEGRRSRTTLTVLMPLKHYHPEFLAKAVGSLFGQDSPDWRLLVIVKGADYAGIREALAGALADPRVLMIAREGRGLAGKLNTGMRRAQSEFVAILFGDDMWAPDSVRVLLDAIARHPDVDFFHSSRRFIDEADRPISSVYPSRENFTCADFVWSSPVKHLMCWRRERALAIGGIDEALPPVGPDDYDFPWCMAEAGARFHAIPECLYIIRDHRETFRLTTHLPLDVHRSGIRRILEKHRVDPADIAKRLADSEQTYLQQCLYLSRGDRERKERSGHDPRTGWREPYR